MRILDLMMFDISIPLIACLYFLSTIDVVCGTREAKHPVLAKFNESRGGSNAGGSFSTVDANRRISTGNALKAEVGCGSSPPSPPSQNIFNVLEYGAKGDGETDDTKAFKSTWEEARKVPESTMLIPSDSTFLVGPLYLRGINSTSNMVIQLDGTISAPPKSSMLWKSNKVQWLDFSYVQRLTVQGNGTIDGNGETWWKDDAEEDDPLMGTSLKKIPKKGKSSKNGDSRPSALRISDSTNVVVTGIKFQNSAKMHLKFDDCEGVLVFNINISAPGNSPNTDGIHLQNTRDVFIWDCLLACGDDCISIQTGCSDVRIYRVTCGPGHGISIGGLGKNNTQACVSNIDVQDVYIFEASNAVRIKSWQGAQGKADRISFSNIKVSEVKIAIVIDQFYCDEKRPCRNSTSAVDISRVDYYNIDGTYTNKPMSIACSDSEPCTKIYLNSINLKPVPGKKPKPPFCWNAYGLEVNTVDPTHSHCLMDGKSDKPVKPNVSYCQDK